MSLQFEDVAINIDNTIPNNDLQIYFSQNNPIHLEIGSGRGTFLLQQARMHSDINYFGIEYALKYYRYAVERICRWGIGNVRLLHTDASKFIQDCVQSESIDMFHIYFPDPWPKRKHHKRRYINKENLLECHRCLKPQSQIRIATDHEGYYKWMVDKFENIQEIKERFKPIDFVSPESAGEGETVGTNFERKYLVEGRKIYTLAFEKIDAPQ